VSAIPARYCDLAVALGVTERTAYGLVADLTEAGYVVKEKDGCRNRYRIQPHLPLRYPMSREGTIGELLNVLFGSEEPTDRRDDTWATAGLGRVSWRANR
jgi:DNA-binding transcriptional ArsR family regulator